MKVDLQLQAYMPRLDKKTHEPYKYPIYLFTSPRIHFPTLNKSTITQRTSTHWKENFEMQAQNPTVLPVAV